MKRFLLFVVMYVCVSIGAWADPTITDNGNGMITLDGLQPGDLATWTGDASALTSATKVVFGSGVELNDEDLAALNTLIPAATQLDMANASLEEGANFANLETQAVQYLRLPNGFTKEADVTKMATLNSKNTALKVVGAYDGSDATLPELALYSFAKNELPNFSSKMMGLADKAMVVRMAGTYGNKDLVDGSSPVFGWNPPCIWDFTGATFAECTLNPGVNSEYYAYNDPFREGDTWKPGNNYKTNAFWYFTQYKNYVVDIKLPTGITELPPRALENLGGQNLEKDAHKNAYKAHYGVTDADLTGELKVTGKTAAIIPTLTIPDSYVTLDYECGAAAHIKHLVIGSGVKFVQGGAFADCLELEDLDFAAGISDCYLSDCAFHGQNNSKIKHIALSEGIVSIGSYCFQNAQQLESIRLPETLTNIGNWAFDNCLALNSIVIPRNVRQIGQRAFNLCPLTDIYLTTTDPNSIPYIWTVGTSFDQKDSNSTFYSPDFDGNNGIPNNSGDHPAMTWEEAATWYYIHANGIPVLHYPEQLAPKVRASISDTYQGETTDGCKIPYQADRGKRDNISGADLGSSGTGKYSQDGWAQLMLMKGYKPGEPGQNVYTKEYDDVWYTMCFPFDLTDEQLAAAFNETFNIVDFSGVEVVEAAKNDGKSMKLILHFNNVAVTDYKDVDNNHYKRVGREKHGQFDYNVYEDEAGNQYHHVHTSNMLKTNKTKTFAIGSSLEDAATNYNSNKQAVMIDGILATAGHPYMIHPAIGVKSGQPKKRCDFAGIEWLPQGISFANWEKVFKENSRTIDLGVKKTLTEKPDSNYSHPGYAGYEGQMYTFIGNPRLLRTDIASYPADLQEPTVENGGLQAMPKVSDYTTFYPNGPAMPPARKAVVDAVGEKMTTAPTVVDNPADDPAYADVKNLLMAVRLTQNNEDVYYYDDLANNSIEDFFTHHSNWGYQNQSPSHGWASLSEAGLNLFKDYFDSNVFNGDYSISPEAKFAELQGIASSFAGEKELYDQYLVDKAAYEANQTAWNKYLAEHETEEAEYQSALSTYNTKVSTWQTDCETVEAANAVAVQEWQTAIIPYQPYIPKNAYFLGRKTGQLPKYYRETADDPAEGQPSTRTGGVWSQFSAIVIPNEAALNGIEKGISSAQAHSKGFDMLFNEDFEGTYIDGEDEGVATAIEEAKMAGADVKYVDIVVSINGQVVRRGSTSIEGLPRGMYIINGKKYFVK